MNAYCHVPAWSGPPLLRSSVTCSSDGANSKTCKMPPSQAPPRDGAIKQRASEDHHDRCVGRQAAAAVVTHRSGIAVLCGAGTCSEQRRALREGEARKDHDAL